MLCSLRNPEVNGCLGICGYFGLDSMCWQCDLNEGSIRIFKCHTLSVGHQFYKILNLIRGDEPLCYIF